METVTIRFQQDVLKNMEKSIAQHNFNSKTEFIREAVRDKLESINREDLVREFLKFRGKAKKKSTYEENRKTREIVSKELVAELEKRFR